ncbi:MAG: HWE histidine kinase domain-containing protein [Oceanicaulis sp.]
MRDTIDRLLEGGSALAGGDLLPRAILDQLPVGVAINRAVNGTWIYHNAEAERILSRAPTAVNSYEDYGAIQAFDADGRTYSADRFPVVRASRDGERVDGEYMKLVRPGGAMIELKVSATPVRDQTGEVVYGLTVFEDVTAVREIDRKRRKTEARLAEVLEATNDGVFLVDQGWTITFMNTRACDLIALGRDLVGENLWEAFPGAEDTAFFKAYREAMESGEPRRVEDRYEPLNAVYEAWAQPTPEGLSVFFKDVTEERAAQQAREALTRELDHRVRNLFLLTSGMIRMGARGHSDVKAFADELDGRIRALAEAHDLIQPAVSGTAKGSDASVSALLETVLKPHRRAGVSVEVSGKGAAIGPKAAADLALILHELATNAAKYGALAAEGGRLEITLVCEAETCRIDWREHRPDGLRPSGRVGGFGAELVQSIASAKLGGSLSLERGETGMNFFMAFPVSRLSA